MNAVERFADILEPVLAKSGEWTRQISDLAPSTPNATLFTHTRRAALLLVPGDDATPAMVRTDLTSIYRRATPKTVAGQRSWVPWTQVIVLLVFQHGASLQMRTFLQGEWHAVTPRQTVQSGWVDLKHGQASFRTARTPFDVHVLEMLEDAAALGLAAQEAADKAAAAAEVVSEEAGVRKSGLGFFFVIAFIIASLTGIYLYFKPAGGKAPKPSPSASASAHHSASPHATGHRSPEAGR